MAGIDVKGTSITVYTVGDKDFISLTDLIRAKAFLEVMNSEMSA